MAATEASARSGSGFNLLHALDTEVLGQHVLPHILGCEETHSKRLRVMFAQIERFALVSRSALEEVLLPAIRVLCCCTQSQPALLKGVPGSVRLSDYATLRGSLVRKKLGVILSTLHCTRENALQLDLHQCKGCKGATQSEAREGHQCSRRPRTTCCLFYEKALHVLEKQIFPVSLLYLDKDVMLQDVDMATPVGTRMVEFFNKFLVNAAPKQLQTLTLCNFTCSSMPRKAALLGKLLTLLPYKKITTGKMYSIRGGGDRGTSSLPCVKNERRTASCLFLSCLSLNTEVESLHLCDADWNRGIADVICAVESIQAVRFMLQMPKLKCLSIDIECTSSMGRTDGLSYFLHLLAAVAKHAVAPRDAFHSLEELKITIPYKTNWADCIRWTTTLEESGPLQTLQNSKLYVIKTDALSQHFMPRLRRVVVLCHRGSIEASAKMMSFLRDLLRVWTNRGKETLAPVRSRKLDSITIRSSYMWEEELLCSGGTSANLRDKLLETVCNEIIILDPLSI